MSSINKKIALDRLRKAKGAHLKWRAYAQALVSGVAIDDDKIPVEHTSCAFGHWYHGEGKEKLGHLTSYDSVYTPHEMLHAIYKRIFDVLHSEGSTGVFKKLFSTKEDREHDRLVLARSYMEELVGVSETLLQTLDILEQEIRELPDD